MIDVEILDEILNGEAKYRIRGKDGNILFDNLTIEMITEILQQGTVLNKALFDSLIQQINYAFEIKYILGTFTWSGTTTTIINCGFRPKAVIIQFAQIGTVVDGGGIIILVNEKGSIFNTYNPFNSTNTGGGPVTSNFTETGFDLGSIQSVTGENKKSSLCNYIAFR